MSARQFLPSLWVIKPDILNPVRDLDIDPFLFQSHMYSLGDLLRRYPQCSRVVFKLDRWDVFIGWGLDFWASIVTSNMIFVQLQLRFSARW
jgi:hypothetical protein